MAITASGQYRHPPRISIDRFGRILRERANPAVVAERNPDEYYQAIISYGIDPLFILAMFNHESTMGKYGVAFSSKSWGNTRAPNFGATPIGDMPGRTGRFPTWASWLDGLKSTCARLVTESWYYGFEQRNIGEVFMDPHYPSRNPNKPAMQPIPRVTPLEWAPAGDLNSPTGYLSSMLRFMNDHADMEPSPPATGPYASVIRGLIDVRDKLERRQPGSGTPSGPHKGIPLSQKQGVVFHYNGPPVSKPGSLDAVKSFARYHVSKNWGRVGEQPIYGDGLMYHIAIGANGEKWLCRDLEAVLWHCGVTYWNERALSIQMIIGDGQRVTDAAKQAAFEVVDDWRKATGTPRSEVFGHYELSPTSCPGSVQQDIVFPYRNGKDEPMADGHFFGETGHYVGGGFWQFWNERGGLPIFGYPVTDEFDIISTDPGTKGRRITIQVFERAVFEYHKDNKPPYDILLRRLGADVKDELLRQAA